MFLRSLPRALAALALLANALFATPLVAQQNEVGHEPQRSPYRDLEGRHEFTLYTGLLRTEKDPAGVAPRNGTLVGVRYDAQVSGPLRLYTAFSRSFADRDVVDPSLPTARQRVGTASGAVYHLQGGIDLALTGQRSWRGFVPTIQTGVGVVANPDEADVGGFRVGTPFALSLGGGVRWVPGGRFAMRLDVVDHLYRINYPDTYVTPPAGGSAVIGSGEKQTQWLHNVGLTLGLTYRLGRR